MDDVSSSKILHRRQIFTDCYAWNFGSPKEPMIGSCFVFQPSSGRSSPTHLSSDSPLLDIRHFSATVVFAWQAAFFQVGSKPYLFKFDRAVWRAYWISMWLETWWFSGSWLRQEFQDPKEIPTQLPKQETQPNCLQFFLLLLLDKILPVREKIRNNEMGYCMSPHQHTNLL